MNVEICIGSEGNVEGEVCAAIEGGAAGIELCSSMSDDGLTPTPDQISRARSAWVDRPGLMTMIRPRPGGFVYTSEEQNQMVAQIYRSAEAGADGVVFGVLDSDIRIDLRAVANLARTSRSLRLKTTFHRAFDATPDLEQSVDYLVDLGLDRILTTGTLWGRPGTAVEGLDNLVRTIDHADDRIEIVIAGGLTPSAISLIAGRLPKHAQRVSFHAYSGAQQNGVTSRDAVESLVDTAQSTYE